MNEYLRVNDSEMLYLLRGKIIITYICDRE